MADQNYPYPAQSTQLEQLAGAAQQVSPPSHDFDSGGTPARPPNPRKRRADGTPTSSRGVANLTPDQLAKKRANDREAQRAIRERTRNTIEALERRIKELESQQPFQDLQTVIRSKDSVLAENEELKRRLASIALLTQFQPGAAGLNDLALATAQQSPLPTSNQTSQSDQQRRPSQQQQEDYPETPYENSEPPPASSANQHHLDPELRGAQSHQQVPTASMHMTNGSSSSTTSPRQTRRSSNRPDNAAKMEENAATDRQTGDVNGGGGGSNAVDDQDLEGLLRDFSPNNR